MPDALSPFQNVLLPVGGRLAPHANAATCLLAGRGGPISLRRGDHLVEGELLLVRPEVFHEVALPDRGADVLYLNGLAFPFDAPLATSLRGTPAHAAEAALGGDASHMAAFRDRLQHRIERPGALIERVVHAIHAEPMQRMGQYELARRLNLERTQALRCFKRATGQTFRAFKAWSAVQHAAALMAQGALVRTAAMDAGFADTAHLSRVFRHAFGLTPQAAITGLAIGARPRL